MVMTNPVSVAPMMDWTDRHCRYFLRLLTPQAQLYTEMVTAAAIVHGDQQRLLDYDMSEHPLVLQLGGSDVNWMTAAAVAAAEYNYDEININVGCPSDRVQSGQFGACLMANPGLVADCFAAMRAAVDIPVTVKTRIGIDDQDNYEFLCQFVERLVAAGCRTFVVHARIAILQGLSPKENRNIPPLNYERVYRLKQDYPNLNVILNGGIDSLSQVEEVLGHVDGVMIGREAYHNPYFLAVLEERFSPGYAKPSRRDIVQRMLPYIEKELAAGERLARITRHMSGLFLGQPGARAWRRYLAENAFKEGAGAEILERALEQMPMAA